jgi:HEAT repeat protein
MERLLDPQLHRVLRVEDKTTMATNTAPQAVFRAIVALASGRPDAERAVKRLWSQCLTEECSPYYTLAVASAAARVAPQIDSDNGSDPLLRLIEDAGDPVAVTEAAKALRELSPTHDVASKVAVRLLEFLVAGRRNGIGTELAAWPVTAHMLVTHPGWSDHLQPAERSAVIRAARCHTSPRDWMAKVASVV